MYMGIESGFVFTGYILCIASAVLCVVYGLLNWNKGSEKVDIEDVKWADKEKDVEKEF
ncbi:MULTISPECIES: symporter small accessory protein [Sedimentisphaera]|uniref:Uncharacterized protein n=2 Tax=Sedimentisphaera TaxID=2483368 RepID=A0A1W6LNG8_9BACT|nr:MULTISPECIES: symporter small accessory protein [Sedimentisphaera]AQQ09563.1 hypothetical protein L21SP3_01369 [Sedimentisphaera cyanobacteriorum]ARN57317.1 hypothetical protein STSP1_01721 [Sedimentisphaera salicampi]OXU14630.1 hypothetical protein SMSP1_01635 [Sedimentisphaera salicampi]